MSEVYRVGIIGCGRIAGAHVRGYRASDRYEIVAVADVKEEARQKVCQDFDIANGYENYADMLAQENLDVVSIATWVGLHAEMVVAVANSGVKGILCEKPMAPSLGEASAMIAACEETGVKLAVGHQHRFDPSFVKAKEMVAAGVIGQPQMITVQVTDGLLNNGTHYVDGVRFILGDPAVEWVMAQVERKTDRYERGEPIEDRLLALVAFNQGTRLMVDVDLPKAATQPKTPMIYGSEGSIALGWKDLALINGSGTRKLEFESEITSHVRQAQEFLRWLDGEIADYRGSGDRAYDTVAVMMAMYESVRIKGLVQFPLTTKESPLKLMIESGQLPVESVGRYDIRA